MEKSLSSVQHLAPNVDKAYLQKPLGYKVTLSKKKLPQYHFQQQYLTVHIPACILPQRKGENMQKGREWKATDENRMNLNLFTQICFILWANQLLCNSRQLLLERQWSYTVKISKVIRCYFLPMT